MGKITSPSEKKFTKTILVPYYFIDNSESSYTLPETFSVKGQISYLEAMLADYIANKKQILKPDNISRHEQALFFMREYAKFKILDLFGVKKYPIAEFKK